ncbi:hypothetical protein [Burkholderia sp. LMG 21824]|uniref:hypothetical protein n=1 Tax=Burkholderia sp. LMG 21824 TaxID=3158172 RepID=UPI003C2D5023
MSNSTTLLDTIAVNQSNKEAVINALLDAASPGMLWGRHASACSGLTWGFYGGQYGSNAIANGTVTLTASATNYVYADNATGAVSVNTSGVPSGKIPLYSIVTGTTTVTSYTDIRSYAPMSQVGSSFGNQTANYVFAGPTSGSAAAPTFRALVGADIPVFGASGASHSTGGVPDPGSTAGATRFLREDGSWQVPSGGGGGGMTNPMTTLGDIITGGAAGAAGRLGVGSNGQVLTVVSGVPAWAAAGGSTPKDALGYYLANNPTVSGFTVAQQTGSTGSIANLSSGRGFSMTVPATNGADNNTFAYVTAPGGSSWTMTAFLVASVLRGNATNFGLAVQDSNPNTAIFCLDGFTEAVSYVTWIGMNSFNSRATGSNTGALEPGKAIWMRLQYTSGGNFIYSLSPDGETWGEVYRVGVTAWLTGAPTKCGVWCNTNLGSANANFQNVLSVMHFTAA